LNADIVIPTYRGEKYLPFLLKSIENQTKKPRKVIIVLKKSDDNSENIIDTFRNKLNTEIIFQENGNIATALQLGIEASNSDVIMFTDDDAILKNALVEKYLNFFNFKKTVHILQLKILGTVAFALKLFMQKAY
jgi:Glycosyltransferases involved in cell wall biogenesis